MCPDQLIFFYELTVPLGFWGTEHMFLKACFPTLLRIPLLTLHSTIRRKTIRVYSKHPSVTLEAVMMWRTPRIEMFVLVEQDMLKPSASNLIPPLSSMRNLSVGVMLFFSIFCDAKWLLRYAEFFYRTHDPTTKDRQGNDAGTQYRSAIFTHSDEQATIARSVTAAVQAKHFDNTGRKIVTTIEPAKEWFQAEDYHQEYLFKNPSGYQCPTHRLHW